MKESESSQALDAKTARPAGVSGSLYLAFGTIALVTLLTTVLGLYSFNRFGNVVQRTTTQTIPLVVGAERLAQRSALLAASAPSIALARDSIELDATTAQLDALLNEINAAMGGLEGWTSPDALADIRRDIEDLSTILQELKGLAEQRFVTRDRHDEFLLRINEVRADYVDTVHPVTYGVNSLMGLFANRAGRRATREIRRLGESEHRSTVVLLTAHRIVRSLAAPEFRRSVGETQLPMIERSFLTVVVEDLGSVAPLGPDPASADLIGMAERLRDGQAVEGDSLDALGGGLQETAQRNLRRLFEAHLDVGQRTRDTINELINTAVKDGGVGAEIRALGSHVISLLNTVAVLESTDAVFEMRVDLDRSLDVLRDALGEFEKSALAQRNPILAGNLRKLEEDLVELRHGPMDPFARRAAELTLIQEISDRLAEGREASNRMAGTVDLLVAAIVSDVEELGTETYDEHLTNSTILAVGGGFSLLAIVIIAGVTATLSRRREVDLRKAKDEAEKASRAKSDFLSSMSHELRTPLHAVLGFAQLLATDRDHPLDKTQKEGVERILKGGDHLLELINQVLDLSSIERGTLTLSIETIQPDDVLSRCLDMARTMAEKRDIAVRDLTHDRVLPLIRADPTRLQQVLLNLLSNAVKYNRTGGSLTLDCQETDGMLRFTVSDTGQGISDAKLEDLFQPFQRLGMEGGQIEGAGIGLTISRELIGLMQGHLGLESKVGAGSTFWVELPLAEGSDQAEAMAPALDGNLAEESEAPPLEPDRHLLLYVEDNPDLLQLMESIVGRLPNTEMISAHTAELGLMLAEKERPDLILMDINLPGMNGIEARRQLSANAKTAQIPVIAVSGGAMPDDVERAMSSGFFAYLTKPFKISDAVKTLREALESRG